MAYYCKRPQRIAGTDFEPGQRIPIDTIRQLKDNVLRVLLDLGRLEFVDEESGGEPVYKGRGWWEWPNGMKIRGTKDKPPQLVEA